MSYVRSMENVQNYEKYLKMAIFRVKRNFFVYFKINKSGKNECLIGETIGCIIFFEVTRIYKITIKYDFLL